MLTINGLNVVLAKEKRNFHILRDVSFDVAEGEILGVAGESASGKTVLAKTIMGLTQKPVVRTSGTVTFENRPLENTKDFRNIRGHGISMIFQNPTSSLNPVMTVGSQIIESLRTADKNIGKKEARARAAELLREVEIDYPEERLSSFPHQLSGGMNQRVMIAIALAGNPRLLIADEPTTALDVTIQQQILELIKKLNREKGLTVIFISHDITLLENFVDRAVIMYSGEIMEILTGQQLKDSRAKHPYTHSLKKCVPTFEQTEGYLNQIPGTIELNTEAFESSCVFKNRCFNKIGVCEEEKPGISKERPFKCHNPVTD